MTQPTIEVRSRGFLWLPKRWEVRENPWDVWLDFDNRDLAVNYALDLAEGNNLRVTINGRPLDDG